MRHHLRYIIGLLALALIAGPLPGAIPSASGTVQPAVASTPAPQTMRALTDAAGMNAVSPARVLDTRPGGSTVDGRAASGGTLNPATTITVPITGRAGIPTTGVGAVVLNITAVNPTTTSYLTIWPTGEPQPNASNLNLTPGLTTPNLVIAKLGTDGTISIYNDTGTTHVLADIAGWFPTGTLGSSGPSLGTPTNVVTMTAPVEGGRVGQPDRFVELPSSAAGSTITISTFATGAITPGSQPVQFTVPSSAPSTLRVGVPVDESTAAGVPDSELRAAFMDPTTGAWKIWDGPVTIERSGNQRIVVVELPVGSVRSLRLGAVLGSARRLATGGDQNFVVSAATSIGSFIDKNLLQGVFSRRTTPMPVCPTPPTTTSIIPASEFAQGDEVLACTEQVGTKIRLKLKNNTSIALAIHPSDNIVYEGHWGGKAVSGYILDQSVGTALPADPDAEAWYLIDAKAQGTIAIDGNLPLTALLEIISIVLDQVGDYLDKLVSGKSVKALMKCYGPAVDRFNDKPVIIDLTAPEPNTVDVIDCVRTGIVRLMREAQIGRADNGQFIRGYSAGTKFEDFIVGIDKKLGKATEAAGDALGKIDAWGKALVTAWDAVGLALGSVPIMQVGDFGLRLVNKSLPNGVVGQAYPPQGIVALGGLPPYKFTVSALPAGLRFEGQRILGTPTLPTRPGFVVLVSVTDSNNELSLTNLPLTVTAAPGGFDPTPMLGNIVRVTGTNTSYFLDSRGVPHWIPDGETFLCLQGRGLKVFDVTQANVDLMGNGQPWQTPCLAPSRAAGKLLRVGATGTSYYADTAGVPHWIQDNETYLCLQARGITLVDNLTQAHVDSIGNGQPWQAQCLDPGRFKNKILKNGTDSWYVDAAGVRHHITIGGVYLCLNLWNGVPVVSGLNATQINSLTAGADATCTAPQAANKILRNSATGETFFVDAALVRHPIPNGGTYLCLKAWRGYALIDNLTADHINAFTAGANQSCSPTEAANKILRIAATGQTFLVDSALVRHSIPNGGTYLCLKAWRGYAVIDNLTADHINALASGANQSCSPTEAANKVIRNAATGAAYFVDGALVRHWIPDGYTYNCLVAKYPRYESLTAEHIDAFAEGGWQGRCLEPNAMKNTVIRVGATGTSYWVDSNAVRHWIPDGVTYLCDLQYYPLINDLTQEHANSLPEGNWDSCPNQVVGGRAPAYLRNVLLRFYNDAGQAQDAHYIDGSGIRHWIGPTDNTACLAAKYGMQVISVRYRWFIDSITEGAKQDTCTKKF